jgi:hypothetical protein
LFTARSSASDLTLGHRGADVGRPRRRGARPEASGHDRPPGSHDQRELHGRLSTRADSTLAALDDDTFTAGSQHWNATPAQRPHRARSSIICTSRCSARPTAPTAADAATATVRQGATSCGGVSQFAEEWAALSGQPAPPATWPSDRGDPSARDGGLSSLAMPVDFYRNFYRTG